MSNFEFPSQKIEKPPVADSEMKIKALITDIQLRKDKNGKDFWIIKTELDQYAKESYLAFSEDYRLHPKTKSLLVNYPHQLVNQWAVLTIIKYNGKEKVIEIVLQK